QADDPEHDRDHGIPRGCAGGRPGTARSTGLKKKDRKPSMSKKLTRRESREAAYLTAFAATFEPEAPALPEDAEPPQGDAFTAQLKGWTLNRVPRVALVALRLALAEMLYGEEQKPGVAINEAVELVKKYGAESDHQFVNGLLGTVAREREESAEAQC